MEEIRESRRLARGDNGLDDGWTALPREICHGRMDPQGLLLSRVYLLVCGGARCCLRTGREGSRLA